MKITIDSAHRFLTSMAAWKGKGGEIVSVEEATRRSAICVECPHNRGARCGGCFARRAVIYLMGHGKSAAAIPYQENPHNEGLRSCEKCGCDLKMKTFLPLGVLNNEGVEYPKWCWQTGPGHEEHAPSCE